jgi:hypothetical protein
VIKLHAGIQAASYNELCTELHGDRQSSGSEPCGRAQTAANGAGDRAFDGSVQRSITRDGTVAP